MKKVLFLIHDLGQGGAEKVLVNLVNHMDKTKYDVSVISLFGGGVNEQFLNKDVHYRAVFRKTFPANSQIMKLLTPMQLHRLCVKEDYDIEVSYLEGPSARIVSGCENPHTKLVCWIHVEMHTMKKLAYAFRSEKEARWCYSRFQKIICVSDYVKNDFCNLINARKKSSVLYNTVESDFIRSESKEIAEEIIHDDKTNLIAVGSLKESKGYERLFSIVTRLVRENYNIRLYVLGIGPLKEQLETYIRENELEDVIYLLGYKTNPYKYVAQSDLFVCASFAEGFSTAVTESLIVGTPVCTVEVSGMKELLGNNEYGLVTENTEEALEAGIKRFLDNRELLALYGEKALIRGEDFSTEETVKAVEDMLEEL